jgi:hypothetical protein
MPTQSVDYLVAGDGVKSRAQRTVFVPSMPFEVNCQHHVLHDILA